MYVNLSQLPGKTLKVFKKTEFYSWQTFPGNSQLLRFSGSGDGDRSFTGVLDLERDFRGDGVLERDLDFSEFALSLAGE